MEIKTTIVEVHLFRETNNGIEFLLLKRAEHEIYPGIWQMVTGHIDQGEKAYEAAIRETFEESGLKPLKMWVVPNVNHFYSAVDDYISLIPVFAVLVGREDKVTMCEEHCEMKWVSPDEAKKLLAWPGQKQSVDIITEYFTQKLSLLNFTEIKL